MPSENMIQHYVSPSGIRLTLADATEAAAEAQKLHRLTPLPAIILGKLLVGTALLASDFKNHEGVSIRIDADGALGNLHADAYEGQFVRGYADRAQAGGYTTWTEEEERKILGDGRMCVTRYSLLKQPYTSTTDLISGEMSENISWYLNKSEQTASEVFLKTRLNEHGKVIRCSGIFLQLLPEGDREAFLGERSRLRSDPSIFDRSGEELAAVLSSDYVKLHENALSFRCTCSEERIRSTLESLPESEKNSLLQEGKAEIVCQYCSRKYTIPKETLIQWFSRRKELLQ